MTAATVITLAGVVFSTILSTLALIVNYTNSSRSKDSSIVENASREGERWGAFNAEVKIELGYIKEELGKIRDDVNSSSAKSDAAMDEMRKWTKEGFSRVHDRLDLHLEQEHGMHVPKRNP